MRSETLIADLIDRTRANMNRAEALRQLPLSALNARTAPERWSALECIEHLNRYGRFYLPEMERRMKASRYAASPEFRSGWLGNYFAHALAPKEKLNPMKTFSAMDPKGSALDAGVLDVFLQQQQQMLVLLDRARQTDLARVRTAVSFMPLLRLRLGDTFRVVIYHNERHLGQAEREAARMAHQRPLAGSAK
jgi:hypothetical protein